MSLNRLSSYIPNFSGISNNINNAYNQLPPPVKNAGKFATNFRANIAGSALAIGAGTSIGGLTAGATALTFGVNPNTAIMATRIGSTIGAGLMGLGVGIDIFTSIKKDISLIRRNHNQERSHSIPELLSKFFSFESNILSPANVFLITKLGSLVATGTGSKVLTIALGGAAGSSLFTAHPIISTSTILTSMTLGGMLGASLGKIIFESMYHFSSIIENNRNTTVNREETKKLVAQTLGKYIGGLSGGILGFQSGVKLSNVMARFTTKSYIQSIRKIAALTAGISTKTAALTAGFGALGIAAATVYCFRNDMLFSSIPNVPWFALKVAGANPNITSDNTFFHRKMFNNNQPLLEQMNQKNAKAVNILLKHGANPNASDKNENTALQCAIAYGDENIINSLFQYGADPYISNGDNHAPLEYSITRSNLTGLNALLQNGVNPLFITQGFINQHNPNQQIQDAITTKKQELNTHIDTVLNIPHNNPEHMTASEKEALDNISHPNFILSLVLINNMTVNNGTPQRETINKIKDLVQNKFEFIKHALRSQDQTMHKNTKIGISDVLFPDEHTLLYELIRSKPSNYTSNTSNKDEIIKSFVHLERCSEDEKRIMAYNAIIGTDQ